MFYEVKTYTSKISLVIGATFLDQNDIEYTVLMREPVKINREQWYIYQVMATLV